MRNWTISIGAHANFQDVVAALRAGGLQVHETLPDLGVVVGACLDDTVPRLLSIPGVLTIEEERRVDIAPPSSPVH